MSDSREYPRPVEFAFDVYVSVCVRVMATSEAEARAALAELGGAVMFTRPEYGEGAIEPGSPVTLFEVVDANGNEL